MPRSRFAMPALLVLAALGASACGPDFDPYQRLSGLRVLALQSEPVSPAPGETTILSPLIYSPAGVPLSYKWSWCPLVGPANEGYPCLVDQASLTALIAGAGMSIGDVPSLDLGTAPTASFPHTLNPLVLAALCAGTLPGVPAIPNCEDGFPVQIRVEISTPHDTVVTIRDLVLRTESEKTANENPQLGQLVAVLGGTEVVLDQDGTVALPRLRDTVIRAAVAADSSEPYTETVVDEQGERMVATQERLFISWFVESGTTQRDRTSFVAGEIGFDKLIENKWKPEDRKDYPGSFARLVVVLRDNRQGVTWNHVLVRLEDPQ